MDVSENKIETKEVEEEQVELNGWVIPKNALLETSVYFQNLYIEAAKFQESKHLRSPFSIEVKNVPNDSEAWSFFTSYLVEKKEEDEKQELQHVRWMERLLLVSFFCSTRPEKPPSWFRMKLFKLKTKNFKGPGVDWLPYVISLWEALKITGRCHLFSAMLPEQPSFFMPDWFQICPDDLLIKLCHQYLGNGSKHSHTFLYSPPLLPNHFWQYVSEHSAGLLPLQNWPEGLVWSGGSVVDAYFQNKPSSPGRDFDLWIWVHDEAQKQAILEQVTQELLKKRPDLIFWNKGVSGIDILVPGADFHIQILWRKKEAAWQIPGAFDLDYVRAYVDYDRKLRLFPECNFAWNTKTIKWWSKKTGVLASRLQKAKDKGFNVEEDLKVSFKKPSMPSLAFYHPSTSDSFKHVEEVLTKILAGSTVAQGQLPPSSSLSGMENYPQ